MRKLLVTSVPVNGAHCLVFSVAVLIIRASEINCLQEIVIEEAIADVVCCAT
jgi:hypothetical protein